MSVTHQMYGMLNAPKYWNEWLAAMHEELEALNAKGFYKEVAELPPGRKAVQCKWVLGVMSLFLLPGGQTKTWR